MTLGLPLAWCPHFTSPVTPSLPVSAWELPIIHIFPTVSPFLSTNITVLRGKYTGCNWSHCFYWARSRETEWRERAMWLEGEEEEETILSLRLPRREVWVWVGDEQRGDGRWESRQGFGQEEGMTGRQKVAEEKYHWWILCLIAASHEAILYHIFSKSLALHKKIWKKHGSHVLGCPLGPSDCNDFNEAVRQNMFLIGFFPCLWTSTTSIGLIN